VRRRSPWHAASGAPPEKLDEPQSGSFSFFGLKMVAAASARYDPKLARTT